MHPTSVVAAAAAAQPPGLDANLVLAFVLLDLVIILVVARAVGWLAQRLRQPRVVGEIVAGVLLGPTVLGATIYHWKNPPSWLNCDKSLDPKLPAAKGVASSISSCFFPPQSQSVLSIIGQLALVLFMFLVGLELNLGLLRGKGRAISSLSVGAIGVPIAFGFLIGPMLFDHSRFIGSGHPSKSAFMLFVGGMLAVTAFPVMARILQEKNLIASDMGASGVAAAAVVTIGMFLALAIAQGVATNAGAGSILMHVVGTVIFLAVMIGLVKPLVARLAAGYAAGGRMTPQLFAALMIVMLGSAYAADRIGINVIVGGFVAGAIMPARERLFADLSARMTDLTVVFLLPVFLAFSGLKTDFTKLAASDIPGLVVFVAAAIVAKWAGSAVFARLGGLSWREGNVLGILMNCRGLLVLVVALIALNSGAVSQPLQVGGVLVALITTIMTGPLVDAFLPKPAVPAAPAPRVPATVELPVPSPTAYHGLDEGEDMPVPPAGSVPQPAAAPREQGVSEGRRRLLGGRRS